MSYLILHIILYANIIYLYYIIGRPDFKPFHWALMKRPCGMYGAMPKIKAQENLGHSCGPWKVSP